jgi:copper chaperone NosL
MKSLPISGYSRIVLLIVSVLLTVSVFLPVWRIELTAPQYPEGLVLQLYANKIGGDVDIINGLNHYIGMKTLHTENFVEFRCLTPIILCFAFFALIAAWAANKKGVKILCISFVLFGVLAALDFYRWNYQYGHDLDPNAAIRVPGMAYQPPLLGYKQLLNFGAYSIPDKGGWLLIAAFGLLLYLFVKEGMKRNRFIQNGAIIPVMLFLLTSCTNFEQVPINLNTDSCSNCKMSISDEKFCSEVITQKGRAYKFDDIQCMINFVEAEHTKIAAYYVHNYTGGRLLMPAGKAVFVKGGEIRSPMNGGIIAFAKRKDAEEMARKYNAEIVSWNTLMPR